MLAFPLNGSTNAIQLAPMSSIEAHAECSKQRCDADRSRHASDGFVVVRGWLALLTEFLCIDSPPHQSRQLVRQQRSTGISQGMLSGLA